MWSDEDVAAFRWRLAETIAWCHDRDVSADPRASLRSDALRPSRYVTSRSSRPDAGDLGSLADTPGERRAAVEQLAEERARLLRLQQRYPDGAARDRQGGSLLLYCPDMSLWDGGAAAETRGFFDDDNTPPWDTWVAFVDRDEAIIQMVGQDETWHSYLISWVPPRAMRLAREGAYSNPEQCLEWARDAESPIMDRLAAAGLV